MGLPALHTRVHSLEEQLTGDVRHKTPFQASQPSVSILVPVRTLLPACSSGARERKKSCEGDRSAYENAHPALIPRSPMETLYDSSMKHFQKRF